VEVLAVNAAIIVGIHRCKQLLQKDIGDRVAYVLSKFHTRGKGGKTCKARAAPQGHENERYQTTTRGGHSEKQLRGAVWGAKC